MVDGGAQIRAVAEHVLEHTGFTVLTAADGREAVAVFQEHAETVRKDLAAAFRTALEPSARQGALVPCRDNAGERVNRATGSHLAPKAKDSN